MAGAAGVLAVPKQLLKRNQGVAEHSGAWNQPGPMEWAAAIAFGVLAKASPGYQPYQAVYGGVMPLVRSRMPPFACQALQPALMAQDRRPQN